MGFGLAKTPFLRGAGSAGLVATACPGAGEIESFLGLDLLEVLTETLPCDLSILLAGAALLATHFHSAGDVFQIDTRRGLIDLLSSTAGAEHETLDEVILKQAEPLHTGFEGVHEVFAADQRRMLEKRETALAAGDQTGLTP